MNIQVAAVNTIEFINKYTYENQTDWPDDIESLSYDHIINMFCTLLLVNNYILWETEMYQLKSDRV